MNLLRLLNPQGMAGIAASVALAVLLLLAKSDARHFRKQSAQYEQLYRAEQSAFAQTVANVRAAAQAARASDLANAARVKAAQSAINERTADDYEARLAAARARAAAVADQLRVEAQRSADDSGAGRAALVPGLSAAPRGIAQAAGEDQLPDSDRLTATEQAIQLDELIRWVKAQAAVDNNGAGEARSSQ